MDLSLLRMLQSMKRVEEDDPSFQTATINLASFSPMYSGIVIVDQRAADFVDLRRRIPGSNVYYALVPDADSSIRCEATHDSLPKLEVITNSVTRALFAIRYLGEALLTKKFCWTIVLKEGLYIDPLCLFSSPPAPSNLKLEIVGLNDVRIVFARKVFARKSASESKCIYFANSRVTLKNVRIYDRRSNPSCRPEYTFIQVLSGANVDFINVKINVPTNACPLAVSDSGSTALLEHCTLKGCVSGFGVANGAMIRMKDCDLKEIGIRCTLALNGASLRAENSRFLNCEVIRAYQNSRCAIQNCKFESAKGSCDSVFDVTGGSILKCEDSFVSGYPSVVVISGSGSEIVLERCQLSIRFYVGLVVENAGIRIKDNFIDSGFLLNIGFNNRGKIEFMGNKLSDSTKRSFNIDPISKKPLHDVEDVVFAPTQFVPLTSKPSDKERSDYTAAFKEEQIKRPKDRFVLLADHDSYKTCEMCRTMEDFSALMGRNVPATEKFLYCANCREVCYCTKECQTKHWPDHRLTCSRRTAKKKSA